MFETPRPKKVEGQETAYNISPQSRAEEVTHMLFEGQDTVDQQQRSERGMHIREVLFSNDFIKDLPSGFEYEGSIVYATEDKARFNFYIKRPDDGDWVQNLEIEVKFKKSGKHYINAHEPREGFWEGITSENFGMVSFDNEKTLEDIQKDISLMAEAANADYERRVEARRGKN